MSDETLYILTQDHDEEFYIYHSIEEAKYAVEQIVGPLRWEDDDTPGRLFAEDAYGVFWGVVPAKSGVPIRNTKVAMRDDYVSISTIGRETRIKFVREYDWEKEARREKTLTMPFAAVRRVIDNLIRDGFKEINSEDDGNLKTFHRRSEFEVPLTTAPCDMHIYDATEISRIVEIAS